MATPPVVPAASPLTQLELLDNLHTEFALLAHKHATVSYLLIGILALVVAVAGVGGYFALRSYDKQLARAEEVQAQYTAAVKNFQTQLAQHDAERVTEMAQVASLEAQIAKRASQPLPPTVQAGLAPNADAKQAAEALRTVYNGLVVPEATPEGKVLTTVKETQILIVSKTQADVTKANLEDEIKVAGLQKGTIDSLQTDLNTCKQTVSEANKTINAYKNVAKPSKWKRFLSGAKTALLVVGAAYLGHKL